MPTIRFEPPGFLDDLNEAERDAWHEFISDAVDRARAGQPDVFDFDGPREQFFNPAKVEPAEDAVTEDIAWTAFPRQIEISSISELQRWRRADASRDSQDEYCEWSVTRDPATDKPRRITFTCEGPEYWQFLAAVNPEQVLQLYREHVDPAAQAQDLFPGGVYRPRNRWNNSTSEGAMHLIQPANTLLAEIELAGGSSVVRARADGTLLTGARELIDCGRYGAPERHSDPHIGDRVNNHTRNRADITLANPVGIYFAGLDTAGWTTPDGDDPASFWRYTRGTPEKPVRAVLEVPGGKNYVLGDVTINGRPISFGGQIADRIQMKLTGLVTRIGQSTVEPMRGCRVPRGQPFGMAPAAARSVAGALAASAAEGSRR